MLKVLGFVLIIALGLAAPAGDKMSRIPGYPQTYNTSIYAGYLNARQPTRSLYYLFVESKNGPENRDPITLWLNGGPGCSSLMGFLHEIGPYYLEDGIDYRVGDLLTENKKSWHQSSNILFLQSPAGVGFSYNSDSKYVNDDSSTALDNLAALQDFFSKFPEYKSNDFLIAGESYAGKYIPDLAVLILSSNKATANKINLKGIMVGNGVIDFKTLEFSTYSYMIQRRFVNPDLVVIFENQCQSYPDSANCRYFRMQFLKDTEGINLRNVYDYCFYNDSFELFDSKRQRIRMVTQEAILLSLKREMQQKNGLGKRPPKAQANSNSCQYWDGIFDYFNLHSHQYHAKFEQMIWNGPCWQQIRYNIDPNGSVNSYRYLINQVIRLGSFKILLYSGTWDAIVPYEDTIYHLKNTFGLNQSYVYTPWFTNDQHSGFIQLYQGVVFASIKGASHQAAKTKRAEAFSLFNSFIGGLSSSSSQFVKSFKKSAQVVL